MTAPSSTPRLAGQSNAPSSSRDIADAMSRNPDDADVHETDTVLSSPPVRATDYAHRSTRPAPTLAATSNSASATPIPSARFAYPPRRPSDNATEPSPKVPSTTHGTPSISPGIKAAGGLATPGLRSTILNFDKLPPPAADEPEFAELLTPAQLRRRRRSRAPETPDAATAYGQRMLVGVSLTPGANAQGFTTDDGDFYRGAAADPNPGLPTQDAYNRGEDGSTIGSGSSGSSSWSWGSGRVGHVMDAVQRFGEAIGVRRGSVSSGTTTTSGSSSSSDSSTGAMSRVGRFGRALTRTMSRATAGTADSTESKPRRVYVPRRREFTLLLPAPPVVLGPGSAASSRPASATGVAPPPFVSHHPPSDGPPLAPTSDRVISTPVLPPILEAIRQARMAAGFSSEPEPLSRKRHHHHHHHHKKKGEAPIKRGGSAPGRPRPVAPGGFALPAVPRPQLPRTHTLSRVDALRGGAVVRPKSASDLLGMAAGPVRALSASNLTSLRGSMDAGISTEPPRFTMLGPDGTPAHPSPSQLPSPQSTPFGSREPSLDTLEVSPELPARPPAAWWLDVSCPTWKDLRDIGELLALHPLTLEDVLHQDPREKLDTYDKLGYYFVVVRALDEEYFKYTPGSGTVTAPPGADLPLRKVASRGSGLNPGPAAGSTVIGTSGAPGGGPIDDEHNHKERKRRGWGFGRATGPAAAKTGEKAEIIENEPGKEGLEGVGAGGVNLYLAVFRDGIVSFHFGDVQKHTKRVLERVLETQSEEPSADWIAHGLLDSIVDAFFPLTGYVDGAVDDMDSLTIDPTRDPRAVDPDKDIETPTVEEAPADFDEKPHEWLDEEYTEMQREERIDEKAAEAAHPHRTALSERMTGLRRRRPARPSLLKAAGRALRRQKRKLHTTTKWYILPFLYLKLIILPTATARKRRHQDIGGADVFDRSTMLRSITNMRRLVTGLSRLLGGKHAVVASLLKRAAETQGGTEVAAYLSDVHDHILLLQTSLYHYEYILANAQPAYLSYLNVSSSLARGGTDILILALSTVTIGILPMQFVLGCFSMNVDVPHNGSRYEHLRADGTRAPENLFGVIVAIIVVIACGVVLLIRYWRWLARQKRSRIRGLGAELPSDWDGFWGWA